MEVGLTSPDAKPDSETTGREVQPSTEVQPATHPSLVDRVRGAVNHWLGADATALKEKSTNELSEIRTDLAVSRNLMAADRTLMAWIRTALSMYSFGFTIYKILQAFEEAGTHLSHAQTPRNIGLFLTGMGTLAMIAGVTEYWQTFKQLRVMKDLRIARPTFVMGVLMAVMGVVLFSAIITKLF
jgi:putative membrane protein